VSFYGEGNVNPQTLTGGKLHGNRGGLLESFFDGRKLVAARLQVFDRESASSPLNAFRVVSSSGLCTLTAAAGTGSPLDARDAAQVTKRRLRLRYTERKTSGEEGCEL
jgi:hypothetical protein